MIRRLFVLLLLLAGARRGGLPASCVRTIRPPTARVQIKGDPYAYEPDREDEFEARAAAGNSHVVYAKSPGGVVATARRVERFRDDIERAADEAGVDPDLIEGMVLLESAGRPDAMASDDLEGAVGLTQILAETATSLLDMQVDVPRERAAHPQAPARARPARGGSHPRQAGPGGRALRPAEVARRDRPLPEARDGRVRPRGPGGGLVPHGHRQPAERPGRVRGRRRRATRRSSSTPHRTSTRGRTDCSPGWATTRRPTSGACWPRTR